VTTRKKVSFVSHGKRVTFYTKSPAKTKYPRQRKPYKSASRSRNNRIRQDADRFIDAGLGMIHPSLPVIKAGARLLNDLFK
jgi:hypothetical protein